MASTNILAVLEPLAALQPATLAAQRDVRVGGSTPTEGTPLLNYDDTAIEYADWIVRLPPHYAGGGLTLSVEWIALTATTGDVVWSAAIRRIVDDGEDLDTSHTYDYNNAAAKTTASATGETVKSTVTFTNGADMDSWTVSESAIVRVRRVPTDGGDTLVGDAQCLNVLLTET